MTGRAVGFGGLFIRARDPEALNAWYATHLGVESAPFWTASAGPVVFSGMKADTDYLGRPEQAFMVNFRVAHFDALLDQLRAAGIEVETRAEWDSELGRFARIHDPEGNPVELWEPGPGA